MKDASALLQLCKLTEIKRLRAESALFKALADVNRLRNAIEERREATFSSSDPASLVTTEKFSKWRLKRIGELNVELARKLGELEELRRSVADARARQEVTQEAFQAALSEEKVIGSRRRREQEILDTLLRSGPISR